MQKTEEFTNRYPEYAGMYARVKKGKVGSVSAKQINLKKVLVAATKVGVVAGALAGAVVLASTILITCVLTSIGQTTASIDVTAEAVKPKDRERIVFYRCERLPDKTVLEDSFLPAVESTIQYTNLEPDTTYRLTFFTEVGEGEAGILDRFEFTTLDTRNRPGKGRTGGEDPEPPAKETDAPPEDVPVPPETPVTLTITTESLPAGQATLPYSYNITFAYDGTEPVSFSASGLPDGLTINGRGEITGTPVEDSDLYTPYTVRVSALAGALTASRSYQLEISRMPVELEITSSSLLEATEGVAYAETVGVRYTGNSEKTPLTFSASGLPAGLSIDAATGAISGTPVTGLTPKDADGSYSVKVLVNDGRGASAEKTLALTVHCPPATLTLTSTSLKSATSGSRYGDSVAASYDGRGTLAFLAEGLPGGLDMSSAGTVTGVPSDRAGGSTFYVKVTVTDGLGLTVTGTVSLRVNARKVEDEEETAQPDATETMIPW